MSESEGIFQSGIGGWRVSGAENIDSPMIKSTIRVAMEDVLLACALQKKVKFEDPYPVDPVYGGPEYETLARLV